MAGIAEDVWLPAAHAAFVACALLFGGTAFFGAWVLPRAGAAPTDARRIRHLAAWSLAGAAAAIVAWTLVQTDIMAGDLGGGLPLVLERTRFGHLVALQGGALLLATACLRRGFAPATGAAALVLVAEVAHGHGLAMGARGAPLVAAGVVHLFAAAIWVGGLPPLLLTVRAAPIATARRAARWFSPPGQLAVAALAASALVQAATLVGSPAALLATRYGILVLCKTLLFALLLGGAWLNRYRFAPALATPAARTPLVATILFQTGCGILAILAAILLGASTPGMDMQRS